MRREFEADGGELIDLFRSLREYLSYLIDSGIREMPSARDRCSLHSKASGEAERGFSKNASSRLEDVQRLVENCTQCRLAVSRTNIVFGEGDPHARILFIGEGPGYEEDQTGRPFVGNAGKKLTEIIERGMEMSRKDVYICNVVKCRPPNNRDPHEDEVKACFPFLERQIDSIKPQVIITLGLRAASLILGAPHSISQVRGRWHFYKGIPVMPTYHPAFVLRNYTPTIRRQVWDDVREAVRVLHEGTM